MIVLGVLAPAHVGHADIRLWAEMPDGAEPGSTDPLRYFDVTGFVQAGYIWRQDDPPEPGATEGNNPFLTDDHFWLNRARPGFRAQLFPWLRMRLEMETTPNFSLQDAFIEIAPDPLFNMRVGQFQLAFLRTFQFNEANLGFLDRLIYAPSQPDRPFLRYLSPRDIGVMVTGRAGDQAHGPTFEYFLGAFLGRGPNQTRDVDSALLWSLRLQLHLFGVPDHVDWESDIARNEVPRVSIAAGAYTNCDDRAQFNLGTTVDAEFRYQGVFASASFVRFNNGPVANFDQAQRADPNLSAAVAANDNFFSGLGNALGYGSDKGCRARLSSPTPADPSNPFTVQFHTAWAAALQLQYVLPTMLFPIDNMALELLARFDIIEPNNPDNATFAGGGPGSPHYAAPDSYANVDNPPSQYRLTFGLNYFPTAQQSMRLGVNYQLRRESEDVVDVDRRIVGIQNDILWIQLTLAI